MRIHISFVSTQAGRLLLRRHVPHCAIPMQTLGVKMRYMRQARESPGVKQACVQVKLDVISVLKYGSTLMLLLRYNAVFARDRGDFTRWNGTKRVVNFKVACKLM